ncbi:hypothetical protein GGTG_06693 [Gaeumannomyces tritici R3-111a-1]|uniref:Uncharacterized protein n=1 Tax=Gaeumannomyces tritici (strain R3-111a-1) TaxID=644352 RepID=J3NZJ5_GAET3|nr:hypothetical protein GGTG_06693 [Gaeumannomyces tritici R3-111a-1]EJT76778.1 hypothetical protein GGTG_06693 [Gaeumannomyces tritici R3-111a-1]
MSTRNLVRATAQYIYAAVRMNLEQALRRHRRCMAADAYVRILTSDPLLSLPGAIEELIGTTVGGDDDGDGDDARLSAASLDPKADQIRARVCMLLRRAIHLAVAGATMADRMGRGGRRRRGEEGAPLPERRHALADDVGAWTVEHVTQLIQDSAECMLGELEHRCRREQVWE